MEAILRPISDAGPNDGSGVADGLHYTAVDEDPHNGDTDFLNMAMTGGVEAYAIGVSDLPAGIALGPVTIRCAIKPGGADTSYRVGFRIGGLDFYGPIHDRTAGGDYAVTEDAFAFNPATNAGWTRATLAGAFLLYQVVSSDEMTLPRPRLTQLVGVVTVPGRPTGTPQDVAASASPAAQDVPSASGADIGADAVVSAPTAASGTPTDLSGGASTASQAVPSTGATSLAPGSGMAEAGEPSATAAAVGPTATVSSLAPTSTLSVPSRSLGEPS